MEQIPNQQFGTGMVSPVPTKKSGFLIKIISVVAALGIISGGALLASRVWDPFWSPFRPSPEKVISAMSEKMQEIKTSHFEVKVSVDIKGSNSGRVMMNFSGNSDVDDPQNIKAEGIFEISSTGQLFGNSAETVSTKLNLKMIGLEVYFNVSEFDSPSLVPLLTMMGINLNDIVGTWISFPVETAVPTASLAEQMKRIVSNSKFYIVKKQLSDQIAEGQKTYHYLVALDNEKTAQLVSDIASLQMEKFGVSYPEADALKTKEEVLKSLNDIGEISAELLIGKNDNLLYGLKIEISIDLSEIDSANQDSLDIDFEINSSRFNQPINIETPVNSKTFDEIFSPLLLSIFSDFDSGSIK